MRETQATVSRAKELPCVRFDPPAWSVQCARCSPFASAVPDRRASELRPAAGPDGQHHRRHTRAGRHLRSIVGAAQTGDTIRLADGTYVLPQALLFRTPGVTFRSASGNRDSVILDGQYQALRRSVRPDVEYHGR